MIEIIVILLEIVEKICFMKFNSKMKGEKKWDFREKKL